VTVVAGAPSGAIRGQALGHQVSGELEVIWVPRMNLPPSHLWYQLMNMNKIRDLLSESDIVHAQDCASFPLICAAKAANRKPPWVVTIHTGPMSELHYTLRSMASGESSIGEFLSYVLGFPLWDVSLRGHAKYADALVGVSQSLSTEILNCYQIEPGKLSTIYTGVNIEDLDILAEQYKEQPRSERVRILYAGRLYWVKGILHLLRSLEYLIRRLHFKDFEMEIIGRGPLGPKVAEFISDFNLSDNVKIRGFVSHQEAIGAMVKSDIVCIPSLYEACPVAMVEAMALAKPVVAFDRPFSRELLGNIPEIRSARNTEDYAHSLHVLCNSEDLRGRVGRRLRSRVLQNFDINIIAEKYSQLYKTLDRQAT
jgi:glycosyltransferase involved in cell wall biosynthesis